MLFKPITQYRRDGVELCLVDPSYQIPLYNKQMEPASVIVPKSPLLSAVPRPVMPLHGLAQQTGRARSSLLRFLVVIVVIAGSVAWYAKTADRPAQTQPREQAHALPTVAQPIESPMVHPVTHDVVYPAQLNLVTDEQGVLVGCSGAVGNQTTRRILVEYIDAALTPMSSQCQWLIDPAYNTQLIDLDTFRLLLQVIKNRPNVLLALNNDDWLSEDTVIGPNGALTVNAATPRDAEQIQVALRELVGQSFTLSALPEIDESTETQRSLALANRLLETLPDGDRRPIDMLRVLNTQVINFAFDQAIIPEANKPILNRMALWLKDQPEVHLDIVGYTDNMGSVAYNLDLSQRRADAIKAYWVEQGVLAKQLNAMGRGQSQPVADNSTSQGRFRNRRMTFLLSDPNAAAVVPVSDEAMDLPPVQSAKPSKH